MVLGDYSQKADISPLIGILPSTSYLFHFSPLPFLIVSDGNYESLLCPPPKGRRTHFIFDADPVGVGVSVGISVSVTLSCLHDIS